MNLKISGKGKTFNSYKFYLESIRYPYLVNEKNNLTNINKKETIFKSPIEKFYNDFTYNDIDIIYKLYRIYSICVTGTNGKTTTCTLINEFLKLKYQTILCGNIGLPLFNIIKDNLAKVFIIELSSFQLKNSIINPNVSIILNLNEAHLDYHQNILDYHKSKLNIIKNQDSFNYLIYNYDDSNIIKYLNNKMKNEYLQKKLSFSKLNPNCDIYYNINSNEIFYRKKYLFKYKNYYPYIDNLLASLLVAIIHKIPFNDIKKVLDNYKNIDYRFQKIKENVYNDAKSTNIYATIINLDKLENIVLICGGKYRLENLNILNNYLNNIKLVYTYGETKELFYNYFISKNILTFKYNTLEEIIKNINFDFNYNYLYSPMMASLDQYNNYEERGKEFNNLIDKYYPN